MLSIKLGRYNESILAFNNATAVDPDFVDAYFYESLVFEKLGRYQDRQDALREGLEPADRKKAAEENQTAMPAERPGFPAGAVAGGNCSPRHRAGHGALVAQAAGPRLLTVNSRVMAWSSLYSQGEIIIMGNTATRRRDVSVHGYSRREVIGNREGVIEGLRVRWFLVAEVLGLAEEEDARLESPYAISSEKPFWASMVMWYTTVSPWAAVACVGEMVTLKSGGPLGVGDAVSEGFTT